MASEFRQLPFTIASDTACMHEPRYCSWRKLTTAAFAGMLPTVRTSPPGHVVLIVLDVLGVLAVLGVLCALIQVRVLVCHMYTQSGGRVMKGHTACYVLCCVCEAG